MRQDAVDLLRRLGPLALTLSLVCAGTPGAARAADVQINTPPGGSFVVKDSAGANTRLKVDGGGPVTVPGLPTAPTYATGVCFDATGALGQCAGASGTTLIHFSTGTILSGAAVVSAAPVLMGFGSSAVGTIDGSGESTIPPEAGGFSFPIPFDGTIQNLQVSAELLVASGVSINTIGLQYDFTAFRAPSAPNNGIDHDASPYLTTPLTTSVRFGFPNNVISAGTFRTATNINLGSLAVTAGDRIGIRVRRLQSTDASAADITQLSFSASLSYTH